MIDRNSFARWSYERDLINFIRLGEHLGPFDGELKSDYEKEADFYLTKSPSEWPCDILHRLSKDKHAELHGMECKPE